MLGACGFDGSESVVESVGTVDDVLDWCEFVQRYDDAIRRELRRQWPGLTDQERIERLRATRRECMGV